MANINIFGALGIPDTDYTFLHTYGQGVVYDATLQALGDHNDDSMEVMRVFVEDDTKDHQIKYKLPGTGRLQRRGPQSRAGEVKAVGEWTIGLPLEDFGAGMAISDVDWGYMTSAAWNRQIESVFKQDWNTLRFEILKAIFNNTQRTFVDPNWGNLSVQPLANNDGVVYPPVVGSEVNATGVNHYLGVPAAATTITDANNPLPRIVDTLEQHFGTPTGGSEIVVFCNNAQTNGIRGLAGFDTVPNRFVNRYGLNVSLVMPDAETDPIPGRTLGESDSAILKEWRWIPSGYLLGIHFGAPAPLVRRVDPPETGLRPGLQMVAQDLEYPFFSYQWRNRYGMGVGNRLNGVVVDLTAAGGANTYTIPALYA